jgi:hypothetical protein
MSKLIAEYFASKNNNPEILEFSCYELAEQLILNLRNTNGLEFMPPEQRMALICELSVPCFYVE